MSDIKLDDLIQKDKEKKKVQKTAKTAKTGKPKQGPPGKGPNRPNKPNPPKKFKPRHANPPHKASQDRPLPPVSDGRKLKVMGLHPDVTNAQLNKLFSQQGALQVCRIDQDNFGRSMMTATVIYHSQDSARQAVQAFNRTKILNSMITVEPFRNRVVVKTQEGRQEPPRNRPIMKKKNFKKKFVERK